MSIYIKGKHYLLRFRRYISYSARKYGFTKNSRNNLEIIRQYQDTVIDFKKSLIQMAAFTGYPISHFIDSYKNKTVKTVRILDITLQDNDPILICAVKDDLNRVKKQLEHHRKIGVKHFAYIDNHSTDGTFEWLKNQNDVSLFTVTEQFNSTIKNAWRRQVTDIFGYNRWYLILDSDEFFTYPGIEKKPIYDYIDFLEKKNIKYAHTPMIDMYANNHLFTGHPDDFVDDYCFFDSDSYIVTKNFWSFSIMGGPRGRLFKENNQDRNPRLSKYSLLKAQTSDLIGTHNNYPLKRNFNTKYAVAFLLHYKFLPNDDVKYRKIIEHGNYSKESSEYKLFMKTHAQNPDLSFYYEKTVQLNSSLDLLKLSIADRKFFDCFLN